MTDTLSINGQLVSREDMLDASRLLACTAHDAVTLDQAQDPTGDVARLADSVLDFLTRFEAKPSVKFATDRAGSEFFEFIVALADAQLASHPDERELTRQNVAQELVDVFYAGFAAASRVGVTAQHLIKAWNEVIRKNGLKTLDTHRVTSQGGIEKK